MDFLKNIALNLKATGPAAVTIVWLVCVTVLGIFGGTWLSWFAMVVMNIGGAFIIGVFGNHVRLEEFKAEIEALKDRGVSPNHQRDQADNGKNDNQPE